MKKRLVPGLIAGIAIAVAAGLVVFINVGLKSASAPAPQAEAAGGANGKGPGSKRSGAATVVDAVQAELGSLTSIAKLTGEVQAVKSLKVYPDTAGRLIEVAAAGDQVEAGGVLAKVDPSKPGSRFEPSPVRSPLSGAVSSVLQESGANVTTSTAILEVATLEDLQVVVRVPERWVSDIALGQSATVTLTALPGRSFSARVRSADPVIDPVSRSKRVMLALSGDISRVQPGMFAQATVPLSRSSSALVIPLEAIVRRGNADFVYVVDSGVARERSVRLGLFSESGAEVLSGLKRGELVVVRGQNLIRDGSRVTVAEGQR